MLSSEFHEERPSAQIDLTRWLWDDTEYSQGKDADRILLNHGSQNFGLIVPNFYFCVKLAL